MRRYTDEEEVRVRMQRRVADWVAAGLLDVRQAAAIDGQLRTGLRRTHDLLRAALGFFTLVVGAAAIAFVVVTFRVIDDTSAGVLFLASAVGCVTLADLLVGSQRLYRHGIEEALALLAIGCAWLGTSLLIHDPWLSHRHVTPLVIAASVALVAYVRFGFVYSGVAAIAFAALVPTQLAVDGRTARVLVALVFASAVAVTRRLRRAHGDEFPGDEYGLLSAAACAGAYVTLNLPIAAIVTGVFFRTSMTHDAFHWATYVATWAIPAAALTVAIRQKDRPLLAVGLVEAALSAATNKPYLGIPRQSWDPIVFGLVLIGVALVVRRWLSNGTNGQRNGYTSDRIAARDRELLTVVSNLSVVAPGALVGHEAAQAPNEGAAFAGGRSGGGGGGASY